MDLREKLERLRKAKTALGNPRSVVLAEGGNSGPPNRGLENPRSIAATDGGHSCPPQSGRDESRQRLINALGGKVFRASQLLDRDRPVRQPPADPLELLDGAERIATPAGETIRVTHRIPLHPDSPSSSSSSSSSNRSNYQFPFRESAAELTGRDFATLAFDGALSAFNLRELLFLDTETTGLAGGTGTYVFLVGLGWFAEDAFVVEQYFMEDYDKEAPLMEAVAARIRPFKVYVSYNGRNFDVPLLRTRFLFNRIRLALDAPNLDLLYPARRIWKEALPNCSLSCIEERVLRLGARESDVSGAFVPRIYFDFVNGLRRERMIPVFDHNAQDIVSLASLLALFGRAIRDPGAAPLGDPLEALGLGRLLERAGRPAEALECMERGLLLARDARVSFAISCRVARLYRKQGRHDDAAAIWASHVERPQPHTLIAFEELGKHLEHVAKDFARGAEVIERALAYCARQSDLLEALGRREEAARLARWIPVFEKRAARLRRRTKGR